MRPDGYFDSPWPAEDGGPQRLQTAPIASTPGLNLRPGERLACTTRHTLLSTMTVLGAPGEVYLLTHSALRARLGVPTTACVERIDPISLQPLACSPRLPGGPMWPGGMALHRNGDLFVVYGRYLHRLDRQCQPLATLQLPIDAPYNSFVVLDNGLIVTKNLSDTQAAQLSVLDPEGLQSVCADVLCPEPSIARLSAVGNTVYVVGVRSIFRLHWDEQAQTLKLDSQWRWDYIGSSAQSYGWDVVIDGHSAWFMDNGHHRYRINMEGAGVSRTANRLLRVSLTDSSDHAAWEVSGLPGGSITNPPLVDVQRRIVLGYDSANRFLRAWRFGDAIKDLQPLWRKANFGVASHMVLFPERGQVVVNDYRRWGEEVVLLDITTGAEQGRVRVGGITQGVVFPSVGWNGDVYWSSMGRFSRVFAA
jgi:hypothetical protein